MGIPSVTYNALVQFVVHFFRCNCEHQVFASAHTLRSSLVANVHLMFPSAHTLRSSLVANVYLMFASARTLRLSLVANIYLMFASAHTLRLSLVANIYLMFASAHTLVANVYLMFIIYCFETFYNVAEHIQFATLKAVVSIVCLLNYTPF
jgi:hypothetical protein